MNSTQHDPPRATNDQLQERLNQLKKQTASMRKLEIKTQRRMNALHKKIKEKWRMHPEYVKEKSEELQKLDDIIERTYDNRRQTEYFMEDMEKELKEENSTERVLADGKVSRCIRYNAYAHPDYEKKQWQEKIDEAMEEYHYENRIMYELGYNIGHDYW